MSQLYTSQPTVNRLLTIFSSLFHSATRPTRHLLAWLLIAQLALESASSVRCLFRQFLSKQTDASLNSYYRALGNGLVTDASIRRALTLRALAIVPQALRQEPILLSVDDTTIAKWGNHFDGVGILYDHAKHDGKSYFNGHAFVTLSKSGSYRLFFSTIDPMALHMSIAWQENKGLRNISSKHMAIYPLKLYKLRWGIETNYYEQKMFWELGSYKVRTRTAIEHLLNLTNAGHALMKILPYEDERLSAYQDKSPQELWHALSQQIHKEVFFATLVSKAQSSINSSTLLKALQALAWGDGQAA